MIQKRNFIICSNNDGTGDNYARQNQSEKKRPILHNFCHKHKKLEKIIELYPFFIRFRNKRTPCYKGKSNYKKVIFKVQKFNLRYGTLTYCRCSINIDGCNKNVKEVLAEGSKNVSNINLFIVNILEKIAS